MFSCSALYPMRVITSRPTLYSLSHFLHSVFLLGLYLCLLRTVVKATKELAITRLDRSNVHQRIYPWVACGLHCAREHKRIPVYPGARAVTREKLLYRSRKLTSVLLC